jgi:hypothetical protein
MVKQFLPLSFGAVMESRVISGKRDREHVQWENAGESRESNLKKLLC